jgi:TrmH family RNA methyltransferase
MQGGANRAILANEWNFARGLMKITSVHNPKIKEVIKLRKKSHRDTTKTFFIEGHRELVFAKKSQEITHLFYCKELFVAGDEKEVVDFFAKQKSQIFECSKPVFQKLSFRQGPDGLLAIAKQKQQSLDQLIVRPNSLFVVVEALEKPGNLGTILRICDGFQIDALICTEVTTDPFNPNVVRASTGALFTVPLVITSKQEAYTFLSQNKVQIIATTPSAKKTAQTFNYSKKSALIFGSEHDGLSSFWLDLPIEQAKIKMHGKSNSFNVAISCAIFLYEARRD